MADNRDFSGKCALITGAARRLGRATALALARAGAKIAIHYNTAAEDAAGTRDEALAFGACAETFQADLGRESEPARLFAAVEDALGPVDVLVNNASIFPASKILDCAYAELDANIRINSFAPLLLIRELARRKRRAVAINLLDARYVDYDREHAAYHLSKRMLASITRMLAAELAPSIRVNAVAPGLILPPAGKGPDYLERMKSANPLNASGSPADVAAAVLFLAAAEFVTGQIVFVDGGRHLRGRFYE